VSGSARGRGHGLWKYSYGAKPHAVFAMERRDRRGQIFVRWTNTDKAGVERRDRRSLGLAVRDAKTGRLDAKLVRAAELAVQQFQARLLVGEPPARAPSEPRPNAALSPGQLASIQTSLTMLAGFALALDPERGKYGSNRTRRYDQMLKYRERLFGGPRHAAPFA
jgi:hypothetical protein